MKAFNDKDEEIEVFSAEENTAAVAAAVEAARKEEEAKYTPKITTLETELTGARTALTERAGEFKKFRELSEDQVKKLDEKDRIIYENGLVLENERKAREKENTERIAATVDSSIRATVGTDQKLFDKVKSMWSIIGINAVTADEIENKKKMILGAISVTEPDLVASVAGFSGGYKPPVSEKKEGETFADTEAGKGLAKGLGLDLEPKKK